MPFTAFSEINSWMKDVFEPLATSLPPLLADGALKIVMGCPMLQIMFHGFSVIRGTGGSNPFLDVFAKTLRAFFVCTLCLVGNSYSTEIRPIFNDLLANLTKHVSGNSNGDIYTQLDAVMQAGISTFEQVHKLLYEREHLSVEICIFGGCKGIHLDGVPAIILQAIVSFFILSFGIFAFIDIQVISQSIVILLSFGPLFLAGFAFESTAKWAEGWLTSAVKYIMTAIVLLVVVMAAKLQAEKFIFLLQDKASGFDLIPWQGTVGSALYQEQGKLIAIMIVLGALLAKASSLAGDMVGSLGIASNAVGMFRSAKGSAMGAAKGMVQGAMGGGGIRGAMKGMAMGAAGMHVPGGGGGGGASRGSQPVAGGGGSGSGSRSSGGGSDAPKSLARRAKQRATNLAAYSLGAMAGKTVGQTRLPALAKEARVRVPAMARAARRRVGNALLGAETSQAVSAASHSSKRAPSAFKDAWDRSKKQP